MINATERRRSRRRMQQRIRQVVADRRLSLALAELPPDEQPEPAGTAGPQLPAQPAVPVRALAS